MGLSPFVAPLLLLTVYVPAVHAARPVGIALATASANATQPEAQAPTTCQELPFEAEKVVAWYDKQGCIDTSPTSKPALCPTGTGPVACTDAEFAARALASAGAVPGLTAESTQAAYWFYNYGGIQYNLGLVNSHTPPGFDEWLRAANFSDCLADKSCTETTVPVGGIVFENPAFHAPGISRGGGRCSLHTSVGPVQHCDVECEYLGAGLMTNAFVCTK